MDGLELTRRMREALESVIGPVGVKLEDHTAFEQQLGMDDLDMIEYEMTLEEEFNIDIANELGADEAKTFGEMKAIVERKLKEAGR